MLAKIIWRGLLDALFPPVCAVCGELSRGPFPHCCPACQAGFEPVGESCCPRCGRPFPVPQEPHLCLQCLAGNRPAAPCRSLYHYRGKMAEALSCLKYGKGLCVLGPLAKVMIDAAQGLPPMPEADMVVPVPASKRSLWKRGFNPSAVLAACLGKSLGIRVEGGILARKGSRPQVGLGRGARMKNARSSFGPGRCIGKVRGKRVLLFDDVYTTGATVRACTKVLRSAGASVFILTLARRSPEDFQHGGMDEPV